LTDEELIWHRGSHSTTSTYMGSPAGSEIRDNVHTINVYAIPLDVLKLDDLGRTIQGAEFTLYKAGGDGAQPVAAIGDNESYSVVASGVSDADGVVHLIAGTKESYLEAGVEYTLVETSVPEGYLRDESVRKVKVVVQDDGTYTAVDVAKLQDGTFGQVLGDTLTGEQLTRPYNWDQGAYLTVDGSEAEIINGSAAQTGQNSGTPTIAFRHGGNLAYRTTVENKVNFVKLDVTKDWQGGDGATSNKIKNGDTITFKVKREYTDAQGTKHTEDVELSGGNIEIEAGSTNITLANNLITLTYNNGWPTAHLVNLLCYAESNADLKYTYYVEETARSTDGTITLASGYPVYNYTRSEDARVNPDQATIVNREQSNIVINVKKEWKDGDGVTIAGANAPENAITFDVYRRATVRHEHVWDEPTEYVDATCLTDGHYTHTCLACGAEETVTIPAKGHHFEESDWQIAGEPYFKEDGLRYVNMERYCRNDCHEEGWHETREDVRYACEDGTHQFTREVVDVAPGCESTGTGHYVCAICGEPMKNADGTNESHNIPATGHDYDLTTFTWKDDKAPNCTEGGTRVYKCNNNCGIDKEETVEPLGHNMVETNRTAEGCAFFDLNGDGLDEFSNLNEEAHTTANTGNIHYECSREGCDHTEEKTIPPHAHKWEVRTKEVQEKDENGVPLYNEDGTPKMVEVVDEEYTYDANTTTEGKITYWCTYNHDHTYFQIIPKTAETFKGYDAVTNEEIDTGLVVEPFEWPNKYKKGTDGNYLTDENGNYIEYTQEEKNTEKFKFNNKTSIIKCVLDPNEPEDVTYGIIYKAPLEKPLNDFLSGPGAGNVNNDTLKLTKKIWTSDTKPMSNNAISNMEPGSLYGVKNTDGTYTWYAVLKSAIANTNGSYNNLHKQAGDIFYKLPPDSETLNGLSASPAMMTTRKTAGMRSVSTKAALGRLGAGNGSETPDTNTGAQLTPAQKSDIAAFLNMSEDNIKSRYESNDHNGYDAPVEVFEFVETVTLEKGDGRWHWESSSSQNADKYVVSDEKGNTYTYFAIEKTPNNYVTTYSYDSDEPAKLTDTKTETIINRQVNLQGTKEWNDEENRQNRPDSLTIHLYKVTYNKDDNTQKSATEISPLNVEWVKNGDIWTYTIKNLTKPAETATERQVYRVVEDVPSGYTAEVSSVEGSTVSNNTITLGALKNKLSMGSLKVTKTIRSTSGETMEQTPTYPITAKVTLGGTEYYVQDTNGTLGTAAPVTSLTVTAGTELTINNLPYGSYTVAETGPDSVAIDDYSYVVVDGTSKSTDTVEVSAGGGQASLVNVYTKGTSWTPGVNKLLNEQAYTGTDFSFTITETTSGASYTETVNSVTSGAIAFTAIPYRAADAGKDFTYAITEVQGNDQNVAYDTATIYAKVSVKNNEGTLSATAQYYRDAACTEEWTTPAFSNTDLGSLTVTKTVSGDYTATDTDAYPITVKKGDAFVTGTVNGTTITYTGLSDTDPQYTVKAGDANKLTFEKLPVGEYVVTEGSISNNGYIITTTYIVNGTDATTASAIVIKGTAAAVDITNHYRNAKLNILKVEKNSVTPLQDAEFTLYKIDETSISLSEDKNTERKDTTNGQGQASFELLPIGYYVIRETRPPAGYVITGENSFYIEVTDTGINLLTKGDGAPDTWVKTATSYGNVKTFTASDSGAQATVENEPGTELPHTGGPGTGLFTILGSILAAGAGLLLWRRRKAV